MGRGSVCGARPGPVPPAPGLTGPTPAPNNGVRRYQAQPPPMIGTSAWVILARWKTAVAPETLW